MNLFTTVDICSLLTIHSGGPCYDQKVDILLSSQIYLNVHVETSLFHESWAICQNHFHTNKTIFNLNTNDIKVCFFINVSLTQGFRFIVTARNSDSKLLLEMLFFLCWKSISYSTMTIFKLIKNGFKLYFFT